ncbi:lytic polysaccharide monooxygenase [Acinetobacter gyllenbergii]|uniref:lytic polysaccharide monooxygenase n=1 Tax=Acinetobacter gyllenbergii TaxID=134534 RepID=UPI003F580081
MMMHHFIRRSLISMGILVLPIIPSLVFAHGYVLKPESRAYACKLNKNTQCGSIVWEPQSLEAPKGFPQSGPPDGQIANANLSQFSELNAQSPTRWVKTNLPTGANDFTWQFTAQHVTQGWRYFITKQGWNPSAPLARGSFDLNPFCTVDGKYQKPASVETHRCYVPADRSGYHVILAVWDIGDTSNAFYNVIDVNVGSGRPTTPVDPQPPKPVQSWNDIGDINPLDDLLVNDRVSTRVFDTNGENPNLKTELRVSSTANGSRNVWPRLLAEAINREHSALRAGIKNAQGEIVPVSGKNDVYSSLNSGIQRVEIKIERAPISGDGSYDFVYPKNISTYKAGTKVLGSDGHTYQCKPFPYSGWCSIQAHQYVPGTGSNWQDAWLLVK